MSEHPARLALHQHRPQANAVGDVVCTCVVDGVAREDYRKHLLDVLESARLLMDTRRPYTGPIPVHNPTWANTAHPHGAVGAPGAVASYAERMGLTAAEMLRPEGR